MKAKGFDEVMEDDEHNEKKKLKKKKEHKSALPMAIDIDEINDAREDAEELDKTRQRRATRASDLA